MQITRDMIVGARILEVYQTFRIADGLDFSEHYFTCDRGSSFRLPQGGVAWETESVPAGAERLQDREVRWSFAVRPAGLDRLDFDLIPKPDVLDDIIYRLKQPAVAQVLCGPYEPELGFYEPWDATLLMTDGFRLSCVGVAATAREQQRFTISLQMPGLSPVWRTTIAFPLRNRHDWLT